MRAPRKRRMPATTSIAGSTDQGFFAIDQAEWNGVCDLGANAAISYLIIARGTGADNRTSSWSVNSIEKYTSISRPRAVHAVKTLMDAGRIERIKGGRYPQYHIGPESCWGDGRELIWLPNSIVDGLSSEVPPVERLSQAQNIDAVRLFVNLYYAQNLRYDGGIEWRVQNGLSEKFKREKIGEYGPYVLWGFHGEGISPIGGQVTFLKHHRAQPNLQADQASSRFWIAQRVIWDAGLAEFVTHLVTADSVDGDVLHALPIDGAGEPGERHIAEAAKLAAQAMCPRWKNLDDFCIAVPILRHYVNVELVGIARLRYRPRTSATNAWLATLKECDEWAGAYRRMEQEVSEKAREFTRIAI